ncbi:SIMPL domain-containing protein [Lacipirellula sp.]|uniref:SIMPL domain-containing protein n=1 Tax=Lacipirellula sp. TaxID=2691419 RepID=UPI003D0FE9F6
MEAQQYVEITGEGKFTETASQFVAEVTVEIRAAKKETALTEAGEYWKEAVAHLRMNGIADEEIVEGGLSCLTPWYSRKNVGETASRTIILKVKDFSRLSRTLESLEPLRGNERPP